MINAGAVGATFDIENLASAKLKALMSEFQALQTQIDKAQAAMRELSVPPGMNRSLGVTETRMTAIANAAKVAGDESAAAFVRVDASAATTVASLGRVAAAMKGVGAEARVVNGSSLPMGAGGHGGGRGGMFHTRGPGASLPGGTHVTASPSGDGFWAVVASYIGADVVKNVLEQGGHLETEKKLLSDKLGNRGTDADIQGATSAAVRYATGGPDSIIGTTPAENLKGIRELMSVTPTLADAEALYGPMMRVSKALEELSGGAKKADETMPVLAKALENLGGGIDPLTHKLDPQRMQTATNEALKTIIAGGGFIDAQSLFGLAKQAGGMGRLSDPGKLFDDVITSLIDMGGPRTGTALAATGRQFLGDKMTAQTATELEDLGLIPHGGWRRGGGTGIIMQNGAEIKGVDELKDGKTAEWFLDTVGPAIKEKYGDKMTTADLMQESYKLFGQQTGQRLGLMYLSNEAQRERDVAIKNGVDPNSVYKGIGDKDLGANVSNLGASIAGLAQVVGGPAVPQAIEGLHLLTGAIQGLTGFAASSPLAAKSMLGTVFTPSLIMSAWDAAKDQAVNLWNHLPSLPANGAGPGDSFGGGAQAATLPTGSAIHAALTNRPGAMANGGGPGDSFKGAVALPPPNVTANITAPLSGPAHVTTGPITLTVSGQSIVAALASEITAKIEGLFRGMGAAGTNGDSGHDGRASAVYPDHMHGSH